MTPKSDKVGFSILLAATFCLGATSALADGFRVRTSFGLGSDWAEPGSLDTSLGYPDRSNRDASLRLMWDKSLGDFHLEIHSNLMISQGDNLPYGVAAAPFFPTPPPASYFDLTRIWQLDGHRIITNTIDRFSLGYSKGNFVLKVGRQAITWGSGMVFHPGDIVAPFAPNAIDTAYKPGVDMVYGQVLFDSGADIQAIAVPRSLAYGAPVAFAASTYAIRGQSKLGSMDASLLLARDRGDSVAALGLGGPLGGASWNLELLQWQLAGGQTLPSWLFNISNYGTLGGKNISYFAEVYHNGFGVDASVDYASLPASLTKRMATGQVFFPGRDFLALGATLELTADLSLSPNAIISLNDHSTLWGLTVSYVLGDNTNLVLNFSAPSGSVGTEFGGRETAPASGIYAGPNRSAKLQLVHFF
ncbi:MAG: hypothetical protein KDA67_05790 [Rhodobacteraceae bacterium]|nr:hypothetical protein [Paracoccaceae bacterium]